uniref:Uncharacterized protein n=1 Tax=Arcella intermedia TaxID=1963864 RepID=A0A6B2L554_9EUKA
MLSCSFVLPENSLLNQNYYSLFKGYRVDIIFYLVYYWFYSFAYFSSIYFSTPKHRFRRITIGTIILFLLMIPVFFTETIPLSVGYIFYSFLVSLIALGQVFTETTLYEYTSYFHSPKHINAIQIGKDIGGLILLLFFTIFNGTSASPFVHLSVNILITIVVMAVAIIYFLFFMSKKKYWDYYVNVLAVDDQSIISDKDINVTENNENNDENEENKDDLLKSKVDQKPEFSLPELKVQPETAAEIYLGIAKCLYQPIIACFGNYVTTATFFPAFLYKLTSNNPDLNNKQWFAIILMFIFFVFSLFGKILLREKYFLKVKPKLVYILIICRIIFIPLWILCVLPKVFKHDVFPVSFMIFFALSDGYCGTYMMMHGSSTDQIKRERSSLAMAWSKAMGITIGSTLTLVLLAFT